MGKNYVPKYERESLTFTPAELAIVRRVLDLMEPSIIPLQFRQEVSAIVNTTSDQGNERKTFRTKLIALGIPINH